MNAPIHPIGELPYAALVEYPVWEFMPESADRDETWVRPVPRLPVRSLSGRVVATQVLLANGQSVLALIGNLELEDPAQNDHFLSLSIVKPNGERFHLARYHDTTYKREGPKALAQFLGLSLKEVFPIEYDISSVAKGAAASVKGVFSLKPRARLSRAELIALAVGRRTLGIAQ
jgi:hypothetical protein